LEYIVTSKVKPILKKAAILILIVGIVFAIYFISNSTPLQWYKHYVYQSQAFLQGRTALLG